MGRFTPSHYPGGGYLRVHQQVGSLIDWVRIFLPRHTVLADARAACFQYNVQFYNRECMTCR